MHFQTAVAVATSQNTRKKSCVLRLGPRVCTTGEMPAELSVNRCGPAQVSWGECGANCEAQDVWLGVDGGFADAGVHGEV